MPEITEVEMKKFKELLDKEKEEKNHLVMSREIYLDQLSQRVDALIDLNKTYGPMQAYALTFSKFILNDFEAHKTDTLFFSWSEIQKYLTERCLAKDYKGRIALKKDFRERLKERGIATRINRKWNTFKVFKCLPKKRTKN